MSNVGMCISIFMVVILGLLFSFPFYVCLIDHMMGTHYSCDLFHWHNGEIEVEEPFDGGFGQHAKCSKCQKEVMQDSQGNWF